MSDNTSDAILDRARAALRLAVNIPYPPGLKISSWWAERQALSLNAIEMFESSADAIRRAQGKKSSFDHREFEPIPLTHLVNFKLAELKLRFPDFDFNSIGESPFSSAESIVTAGGNSTSSIFLSHLYFYLRTEPFTEPGGERLRIAEIGSGYGGLARIYKEMEPYSTYVCIDLPESLFYAQVFIEANFPNAKTLYVQDTVPVSLDDYDFVFVPAQNAHLLEGQSFDLTINTGSLQEMPSDAVFYWMDFIQNTINTKAFYSWNYFLNDRDECPEAKDSSLICPIIDPFWIPLYFRINEPLLTVDCNQRNWLEVMLERIPREQHSVFDRFEYAKRLIENANGCRPWTNNWFQNIWMTIWENPEDHIVEAMINGINKFAKGEAFGITNYLPKTTEFSETRFYNKVRLQVERALNEVKPAPIRA